VQSGSDIVLQLYINSEALNSLFCPYCLVYIADSLAHPFDLL